MMTKEEFLKKWLPSLRFKEAFKSDLERLLEYITDQAKGP